MTLVIIEQRQWQRRGTEAEWIALDEPPASGEICVTEGAGEPMPFKIGNGVDVWSALPYHPTTASGGYLEGTSFPLTPATNDKFYRTDLNYLCYYDGTRWLTDQEYSEKINDLNGPLLSSGVYQVRSPLHDGDVFITKLVASTFVNGANGGSTYWNVRLEYLDSADVAHSVGGFSTGTTPDAGLTWIQHTVALNTLLSPNARALQLAATIIGGAGNLFAPAEVFYRLVVP